MFVWWTETRIIEHGGFVQCTLLLGPSGLVMINHLTASDQWKQPSKRLTLMENSAVSLSTGHLEPRICDVVVRLTEGTVILHDSKAHMLSVPTVCRTLSDCSRTHLAQLLVLVQGQMVVLHCLRRVSKTTSMESFGGMLLVKAVCAVGRCISLACMFATVFCKCI